MRYRLRVFHPVEGVRSIELDASSAEEASVGVRQDGVVILAVTQLRSWRGAGRTVRFELLQFSQELLSLMDAGLNLVEAIETLGEKESDSGAQKVIADLAADLRTGLSMSRSLARNPSVFPPLYRAAIEASERTGGVQEALKRFIAYETRFQQLRNRLLGALIYPGVLLTLGALVIAFLLVYVVPRFSTVFADRLTEMPFLSGLVVRLGMSISAQPWIYGGGTVLLLGAMIFALTSPQTRAVLLAWAWRLPWLGERWRRFELVRLYRSLGMLIRGGVPAVAAMQMASVLMPASTQAAFSRAIGSVREGQPISVALRAEGFSTLISDRMLSVGEKSGSLGDMLERAADFIDEELARTLDWGMRMMEPVMMVVIGGVVGGIVMLMYLPIFELADSVR